MNQRQLMLLRELESSSRIITAKQLAEKYKVSIRTIRNDMNVLSDYVSTQNASLISIPGSGMRLVTVESLAEKYEQEANLESISLCSQDDRKNLLMLYFLLCRNPLTVDRLADELKLSRGTIFHALKELNETLYRYHLKIQGKRNHGYTLEGEELDVLALINSMMPEFQKTRYQKLFLEKECGLFPADHDVHIGNVIRFISETLNWHIRDNTLLYVWFSFFICRLQYGRKLILNKSYSHDYRNISDFYKLEMLSLEIRRIFKVKLDTAQKTFLAYITLNNVDWSDEEVAEHQEDQIDIAVQEMIQDVARRYPSLLQESGSLQTDIVNHIQLTLNRHQLKLDHMNPMLGELKSQYGDVFAAVSAGAEKFANRCGLTLSEDEIGFLTLHFCKYLENRRQISESHVLVVCNSGRGASKLLATKLTNNLPGIHIISVTSLAEAKLRLQRDHDIDLVLSTVTFPQVGPPSLVVSPILTKSELDAVRSALYTSQNRFSASNPDQSFLDEFLSQNIPGKAHSKSSRELETLIQSTISERGAPSPDQAETCYANIIAEITNLGRALYPDSLTVDEFTKITGIMIHCQMSVTRWQAGNFLPNDDYAWYRENHPVVMALTEATLEQISELMNLQLPPCEAVAIVRYLI